VPSLRRVGDEAGGGGGGAVAVVCLVAGAGSHFSLLTSHRPNLLLHQGEVDRARGVFTHGSQFCDPKGRPEYWDRCVVVVDFAVCCCCCSENWELSAAAVLVLLVLPLLFS